jgi:O-antigen/teichoic acid export membrane protein
VGLKIEPPRLLQLLRDAWPVGLTVLLAVVYLKLDSVLLGVFSRQEEVGLYGAAYRPIEYLILASSVLIHPVFPLLARWQGVDARRFKAVFQGGTTALLAVLLPVPVIVCLVADPLVRLLYAPEFAAAAAPLRLLSVAMVFVTFAVWQDFTLLSIGRQRITLAYGAVGVGLNIALNLVLIPQAGAVGAAWAALATGVVFSASAFWACQRFARVAPDPRTTTGLLLANASLAGILWVLLQTGLNWPIATLGAGLAYLGLLFVFQVTSVAELHQLLPEPSPAPDNPPLLEAA